MSGRNGDSRPRRLPWRSARAQQLHPLVLGLVILLLVLGLLALLYVTG